MITRISLLSILITFTSLIYSQDKFHIDTTSNISRIGLRFYAGTIVPHDNALKPLKKGLIKSFELSYSIIKNDNKVWRSYYNFPEVGFSFMLMDLGYKDVLGYSHSVFPFIVFPITKHDKPLRVNLRVAIGLSYITKMYDSISNPKNVGISTPINMYASLGLTINYTLSSHVSVNAGINGSHFSNGSIKKPNYGLNILTGSIGVNYILNQNSRNPRTHTDLEINKSRWLAIFSGGIKETNDPGGSKYGIGSLSMEYSKSFKSLLRYGATFDYMYDASTLNHFEDKNIPYQSKLKASKIGLTLMGEMTLYRLSAFGNLGVYIYNHDKQNKSVYQRIGIRYRLSDSFYSQIALKTHLNVADYIEFGIGFKVN